MKSLTSPINQIVASFKTFPPLSGRPESNQGRSSLQIKDVPALPTILSSHFQLGLTLYQISRRATLVEPSVLATKALVNEQQGTHVRPFTD